VDLRMTKKERGGGGGKELSTSNDLRGIKRMRRERKSLLLEKVLEKIGSEKKAEWTKRKGELRYGEANCCETLFLD